MNNLQKKYSKLKNTNAWNFQNKILYEMCKTSPLNQDLDVIAGKLLLIGRSYSAALERTSNKVEDIYFVAAKKIRGSKLDNLIEKSRQADGLEQFDFILEVVSELNNIFKGILKTNKISLSSKYLHFHNDAIPIYDSISKKSLTTLIPMVDLRDSEYYKRYWNRGEYGQHLARFLLLREKLSECGFANETSRQIDTFLLGL